MELIVRGRACLAEGLGIRGTARVFAIDPNTVLQGLGEAAEQLQACSQYVFHDVRVTQVPLDEHYALLRAVKDSEVSEAEAIDRLERSPQWVWVAIDPVGSVPGSQAAIVPALAPVHEPKTVGTRRRRRSSSGSCSKACIMCPA